MQKQLLVSLACFILSTLSCGGGKKVSNDCVPQVEVCDGVDNDCDGQVDEDIDASCDDGIACTADSCQNGKCQHLADNSLCDDGLFCNGKEICRLSTGCISEDVPLLDDGIDCTVDSCDEEIDMVIHASMNSLCDDGLFCNGAEICDSSSGCQSGDPPDCSGFAEQCLLGVCDEEADACGVEYSSKGKPCDDGLFCTTGDTCDGLGSCLGSARDCSALDDDCNEGLCDEISDNCYANTSNEGGSCDDGLFCTVGDICQSGVCRSSNSRDCDDGLFCTGSEICNEDTDSCESSGDPCPGTECNACNESEDSCFDPAGVACGDFSSSLCNHPDTCDGLGRCLPHLEADDTVCEDDGDVCTVDACQDGECLHSLIANDCGSYECGSSPSGCFNCGTCAPGYVCANHQCTFLHVWSESFGTDGSDKTLDIAVDSKGDVYIAGSFGFSASSKNLDFGQGVSLTSPDNSNEESYIAKFDTNDGKVLWAKNFGYIFSDTARLLAVDNSDNVYVAGVYKWRGAIASKSIDLGGGPLENRLPTSLDVYLGGFDSTGNHFWSKSFFSTTDVGAADDYPRVLDVDAGGYIYFGGEFRSATFSACYGGAYNQGKADIFFMAIKPQAMTRDCGVISIKPTSLGGENDDTISGTARDNSNNVYLLGSFQSSVLRKFGNIGEPTLFNKGYSDIFVVKMNINGEQLWAKGFGSAGDEISAKIITDGNNIYITGQFSASDIDFGGGPLSNRGRWDIFFAKLDQDGKYIWSKVLGGSENEFVTDLAIGADGDIYLLGHFDSTDFDLGDGALSNAGGRDIFLAKFDQEGNHLWSMSFGGDSTDWAWGLAVDSGNNIYLAGSFESSSIDFGGGKLFNKGYSDIFLVKLSQ